MKPMTVDEIKALRAERDNLRDNQDAMRAHVKAWEGWGMKKGDAVLVAMPRYRDKNGVPVCIDSPGGPRCPMIAYGKCTYPGTTVKYIDSCFRPVGGCPVWNKAEMARVLAFREEIRAAFAAKPWPGGDE